MTSASPCKRRAPERREATTEQRHRQREGPAALTMGPGVNTTPPTFLSNFRRSYRSIKVAPGPKKTEKKVMCLPGFARARAHPYSGSVHVFGGSAPAPRGCAALGIRDFCKIRGSWIVYQGRRADGRPSQNLCRPAPQALRVPHAARRSAPPAPPACAGAVGRGGATERPHERSAARESGDAGRRPGARHQRPRACDRVRLKRRAVVFAFAAQHLARPGCAARSRKRCLLPNASLCP